MFASEDPLSYVFHVISYLQATNPAASEADEVTRLSGGLPTNLKSSFVRDTLKTVQEFTNRLRDVARESAYAQKALLQGIISPSVVTALTTTPAVTGVTMTSPNSFNGSIGLSMEPTIIPAYGTTARTPLLISYTPTLPRQTWTKRLPI